MMTLFMEHLVTKLDKENPYWRNNTILCWDGASYHRSKDTLTMLERLNVPIMMSGPYSYEAAPCELYFAAFKNADVNPTKIPLGKSHFDIVLRLVVERCQQIPKFHTILNWHHCLLYVYRYLSFHKI